MGFFTKSGKRTTKHKHGKGAAGKRKNLQRWELEEDWGDLEEEDVYYDGYEDEYVDEYADEYEEDEYADGYEEDGYEEAYEDQYGDEAEYVDGYEEDPEEYYEEEGYGDYDDPDAAYYAEEEPAGDDPDAGGFSEDLTNTAALGLESLDDDFFGRDRYAEGPYEEGLYEEEPYEEEAYEEAYEEEAYDGDGYEEAYYDDAAYEEDAYGTVSGKRGTKHHRNSSGKQRSKAHQASGTKSRKSKHGRKHKGAGIAAIIGDRLGEMGAVDKVLLLTAVAVFVCIVLVGGAIMAVRSVDQQVSSFAEVGSDLSGVNVIGESGLIAMNMAKLTAVEAGEIESSDSTEGIVVEEENAQITVSLKATSIVKDLKLKFVNDTTGKLIANVPFEVTVTDPSGTTSTWTDDDKDGIIYKSEISGGTYKVAMVDLSSTYENYTFSTSTKSIEVLSQIAYKTVDVSEEVKTEAEVNVSVEDTEVDTKTESELTDTVPFLESTSSTSTTGYKEIDKSTITDPSTLTSAVKSSALSIQAVAMVSVPATSTTTSVDSYAVTLDSSSASVQAEKSVTLTATAKKTTTTTTVTTSEEVSGNDSSEETTTETTTTDVTSSVTFSWSSSNTSVATVDSSGKVTGVATGTATISVTIKGQTCDAATCSVTVSDADSLTVSPTSLSVQVGATATSTATTVPSSATISKVASSNTSIATVSYSGKTITVKGVKAGTCNITVTDSNSKTATIAVTVAANSVTVSPTSLSVQVGATATSTATTVPSSATISKVASSDTSIATVSYSNKTITVKGVKAGTCNITVTDSNSMTATIAVTVSANAVTLDPTSLTVVVGKTATTTATTVPSSATISKVASSDTSIATVSYSDKTITVTGVKAGTATITVTDSNSQTATCAVTVKVSAAADTSTKLKDKSGNQVYVLDNGSYREAVYADYFTFSNFYIATSTTVYTGWQSLNGNTYYFLADHTYVTGEQVIQGAKYTFNSDGILQTGSGLLGIDVSKWNGSIDWASVKNSGVSYVIIRCGYRGSSSGALIEDPKFASNIKGATAAGLNVGVYFFSQAISEAEAIEEASMVNSLISGYSLKYPVFIDVEASNGRGDTIDASTRTAVCNAFCATIQNAGYKAGVYSNKTWLAQKMNVSALSNYKIWLAQYASAPTYSGSYQIWQYSSKGSVAGISGNVDMNLSYLGY